MTKISWLVNLMELRKDYFQNKWVIIAEKRGVRPHEFKKLEETVEGSVCYFCPGSESLTPPEIMRIGKPWRVRVFPNKFPAVDGSGQLSGFQPIMDAKLLPAIGTHEVIVETPDHKQQLADLPAARIREIFNVYSQRIEQLEAQGAKYVLVFKNNGRAGGTSLVHSHTQIISLPIMPHHVVEEQKDAAAYQKKHGVSPYVAMAKAESKGPRFIMESGGVVAFAPYASAYNFQARILPKRTVKRFSDLKDKELAGMALCLSKVLKRLKSINAAYNFFIHYGTHLHIEITPRIATWAGFELSGGVIINSVSPELAARYFRTGK